VSHAWKDLERRVCRALGGQRSGPTGRRFSDCIDVPLSVEVKRSSRHGPPVLAKWIQQARTQGLNEGHPWLLVVAGHYDRKPVAVCDFTLFLALWGARVEGMTTPAPAPPSTEPLIEEDTDESDDDE
jgi:hypothetical protein